MNTNHSEDLLIFVFNRQIFNKNDYTYVLTAEWRLEYTPRLQNQVLNEIPYVKTDFK